MSECKKPKMDATSKQWFKELEYYEQRDAARNREYDVHGRPIKGGEKLCTCYVGRLMRTEGLEGLIIDIVVPNNIQHRVLFKYCPNCGGLLYPPHNPISSKDDSCEGDCSGCK